VHGHTSNSTPGLVCGRGEFRRLVFFYFLFYFILFVEHTHANVNQHTAGRVSSLHPTHGRERETRRRNGGHAPETESLVLFFIFIFFLSNTRAGKGSRPRGSGSPFVFIFLPSTCIFIFGVWSVISLMKKRSVNQCPQHGLSPTSMKGHEEPSIVA
jgi:hypothetical protein